MADGRDRSFFVTPHKCDWSYGLKPLFVYKARDRSAAVWGARVAPVLPHAWIARCVPQRSGSGVKYCLADPGAAGGPRCRPHRAACPGKQGSARWSACERAGVGSRGKRGTTTACVRRLGGWAAPSTTPRATRGADHHPAVPAPCAPRSSAASPPRRARRSSMPRTWRSARLRPAPATR